MSDRNIDHSDKQTQNFEYEKVDPDKSLWNVAYEHVLPPHSDPSVNRCVDNILQLNNGSFHDKEFAKIPFPCDPQDAAALLKSAATNLVNTFEKSDDAYDAAAKLGDELSKRSSTLSTPNRDYNNLIEQIHNTMQNEPFDHGVRVGAEHWNSTTHTWDNVYVMDNAPNSAPVRIAQPGNTVRSIADDRMQILRNEGIPVNSEQFTKQLKELNGLNVAEIYVGMPVRMPY